MSESEKIASRWIDENRERLSEWTSLIWRKGETAWREYESAAWYVRRLREEGFEVEECSGGMPTAFAAVWSNGDGPSIASYAEYDAVPGNCQAAAPERRPRDGLSVHAGGHTDPHSALGISALGGILAAKAAMQREGLRGTLKLFGEPAEKIRGSKPIHAAKGYYDGLDAMISFHPYYMPPLCNTARWNTHCGAAYAMVYRFLCDEPETYMRGGGDGAPFAQSHSAVRAPGANDALMTMYAASKGLRDSMLPHSGGWSISEAILTSGQATADNLPARLAEIQYIIRVPTIALAEQATAVLDRNAEAAAAMTHCRFERIWVSKSRPGLPNHTMARLVYEKLCAIGPPQWDTKAKDIARQMQAALGIPPMDEPFPGELSKLTDPEQAEAILRRDLPETQINHTSDDYTEMCWHTPTARFYVGRPTLAAPEGTAVPDWTANALGGIPETIDPMVVCAAKTIACSVIELITNADLRRQAMQEFRDRTGGGIGGTGWLAPLCDYDPPIGLRWPEYVTTARGRDWWIPSTGYAE